MRISDWSSDVCSSDLNPYRLSVSAWARRPVRRSQGFHSESARQARTHRAVQPHEYPRALCLLAHRLRGQLAPPQAPTLPESPTQCYLPAHTPRSEEHTSELQSPMRNSYAVFCLTK